MLRIGLDIAAGATAQRISAGAPVTLTTPFDRNPANAQLLDGTDYRVNIDLTAVQKYYNCLCLFGMSASLIGAKISTRSQAAAFVNGDYAGGLTYWAWVTSDRIYIPIDLNYARYVGVMIEFAAAAVPAGPHYVGEISLGVLESPTFNYQWGLSLSQSTQMARAQSLGGVDWIASFGAREKYAINIGWNGVLNEQDVAQIKYFYDQSKRGLWPLIIHTDDTDRTNGTFYARMPSDYSKVQDFFNRESVGLQFTEAVGGDI